MPKQHMAWLACALGSARGSPEGRTAAGHQGGRSVNKPSAGSTYRGTWLSRQRPTASTSWQSSGKLEVGLGEGGLQVLTQNRLKKKKKPPARPPGGLRSPDPAGHRAGWGPLSTKQESGHRHCPQPRTHPQIPPTTCGPECGTPTNTSSSIYVREVPSPHLDLLV